MALLLKHILNLSSSVQLHCFHSSTAAAAAAKSLQSCPTLCDPIDGSPPGSPVHGIFQARVLEWGAIAFSVTLALPAINSYLGHYRSLVNKFPSFTCLWSTFRSIFFMVKSHIISLTYLMALNLRIISKHSIQLFYDLYCPI